MEKRMPTRQEAQNERQCLRENGQLRTGRIAAPSADNVATSFLMLEKKTAMCSSTIDLRDMTSSPNIAPGPRA